MKPCNQEKFRRNFILSFDDDHLSIIPLTVPMYHAVFVHNYIMTFVPPTFKNISKFTDFTER